MTEDETPLHQIISQRFLKAAGQPPAWTMGEQKAIDALGRNRMAIGRALLITIGVFLIVQAYPPDFATFWTWIKAKIPGYETHWAWYFAGLLFIAAVQAHWIGGAMQRAWRHCKQTRFAPVFTIVGIAVAWTESREMHVANLLHCSPLALAGWVLVFVSLASRFWISAESADDFKDRLQRSYFVERLLVCFKNPHTTLRRIAVLGGWGTGKTVVLRLLRKALLQSTSPKFGVAMINPWVSQNIEEVHVMITRAFEEALGYRDYFQNPLARSRWASVLTSLKLGGSTEIGFDLQQLFRGGSSSREDGLVRRINDTLQASGRVCVILVDDMERAEPEVIRRVFPLIDLLRRIEHCFFVFGIDPARVARAFKERSASGDQTKGYLDKVFDLQLSLPQARPKDIANMCRDLIDPLETPKLHAAWNSIKSHLPVTPREAIHFMRDAIMRETLFLSRYGPNEHDYAGFFQLRLLALEFPGMVDHIDLTLVNEFREAKDTAELLGGSDGNRSEKAKSKLEEAWNRFKATSKFPNSREDGLRSLFANILASRVDLRWACHHHMRLLTLNEQERTILEKVWRENAGKMSIIEMIRSAVPGITFDDQEESACQLLETEMIEYESIRNNLINSNFGKTAFESLEAAMLRLQNLIAHIQFSVQSKTDLEFYPVHYFDSWQKIAFRQILDDRLIDCSALRKLEAELSVAMVPMLGDREAFSIARHSVQQILEQEMMGYVRNDLIPHIKALKDALASRFYNDFMTSIQNGDVRKQTFLDRLGIRSLSQVFGDLESWNPYADTLSRLRDLEDQAPNNSAIADSMAAIAINLLTVVELMVRESTDYRNDRIRKTLQNHPDYIRLIWRLGQKSKSLRDELFKRYNFTRNAVGSATAVTTVEFDCAFPPDVR